MFLAPVDDDSQCMCDQLALAAVSAVVFYTIFADGADADEKRKEQRKEQLERQREFDEQWDECEQEYCRQQNRRRAARDADPNHPRRDCRIYGLV